MPVNHQSHAPAGPFMGFRSSLCSDVLPWTKKRTIPEIRGEKNAVPSCDIIRVRKTGRLDAIWQLAQLLWRQGKNQGRHPRVLRRAGIAGWRLTFPASTKIWSLFACWNASLVLRFCRLMVILPL